jgi:hypothetical protein
MKMLLGHFTAKVGSEDIFKPTLGRVYLKPVIKMNLK